MEENCSLVKQNHNFLLAETLVPGWIIKATTQLGPHCLGLSQWWNVEVQSWRWKQWAHALVKRPSCSCLGNRPQRRGLPSNICWFGSACTHLSAWEEMCDTLTSICSSFVLCELLSRPEKLHPLCSGALQVVTGPPPTLLPAWPFHHSSMKVEACTQDPAAASPTRTTRLRFGTFASGWEDPDTNENQMCQKIIERVLMEVIRVGSSRFCNVRRRYHGLGLDHLLFDGSIDGERKEEMSVHQRSILLTPCLISVQIQSW